MSVEYGIIIFYKYTHIAEPYKLKDWIRATCEDLNLLGRIIIAPEGINGTVEGTTENLSVFEGLMHEQDGREGTHADFSDVWFKHSPGHGNAFPKLKTKVREEIVTLGLGADVDIDPNEVTGTHITPKELKQWFEESEDFHIIDMRNDYEYNVGHFKGAINSNMENFRDLKKVVPELASLKKKKIVTVCTYGVRCEKASGYLREQGFEDVYQLDGGIGTYMKTYPGEDFLGSLYVFDGRITERFTDAYEIIGICAVCGSKSEHYGNCAWDECHKKMIFCESCENEARELYCDSACRINHSKVLEQKVL